MNKVLQNQLNKQLQYQLKINQLKKLNTNRDVMAGMTQKTALKALFSLSSLENRIYGI